MYGVQIKRSGVPGAGNGLFATRPFVRGENICPYLGDVLSREETDERYGPENTAPYSLEISRNRIMDSACKRGLGAWVNHAPAARTNARFVISSRNPPVVWVRATKKIPAGREILLSYGNLYNFNEPNVFFKTRPYD
jgi:SET domain-containing protein